LKILVGCESTQTVTKAFRDRGHEAYSCDILPTDGNPDWHFQEDIFSALKRDDFDLGIFHPPCTYLCSSGLHWNTKRPERTKLTEEALSFVIKLLSVDIPKICLENPVGRINTTIRAPDQYIQPYDFGHDASKKTGLWLKGLPLLQKTRYIEPRIVNGKKRWGNQTDSGQNKLQPSKNRWKLRSMTYQGWADAMADQWSFS